MIEFELSPKTVGPLAIGGFLIVLLLLLIDPSFTLSAANRGLLALLMLFVFPVSGPIIGVYTYVEGPYHGALMFPVATYLGVVGLTMVVGFGLSPGRIVGLQLIGLILFALSLVALLYSAQRFAAFVGLAKLLPSVSEGP